MPENKEVIDRFVEKMKLREAGEGANLIFLLPYYTHSVFYGKQKIRSVWVVSDLQLYLDLHKYPIRGLGAGRASLRKTTETDPRRVRGFDA